MIPLIMLLGLLVGGVFYSIGMGVALRIVKRKYQCDNSDECVGVLGKYVKYSYRCNSCDKVCMCGYIHLWPFHAIGYIVNLLIVKGFLGSLGKVTKLVAGEK